jgi:uncharacterized delta-60 repeat protein
MKPPRSKSATIVALIHFCILSALNLSAQNLDESFISPELRRFAFIDRIIEAPGGKIYILGEIDFFDKTKVGPIVRLTAQGGLDKTFKTSLSFYEATVDRAGALIGFTPNSTIVKLKANGTVEKTISISPSDFVNAFLALPDGRILVATSSGGLTCYTSKLTIDPTFKNSDSFVNGAIGNLALQGSKIIISGSFSTVNGIAKNDIARIDKSGVLDNTFDIGLGSHSFIKARVRSDLKIYFRGPGDFNRQTSTPVMRLNPNGTIDKTFRCADIDGPYDVLEQGNKFVVIQDDRIIRLNNNGSQDQSFSAIEGTVSYTGTVLSSGDIMASIPGDQVGYGIGKFQASGHRLNGFTPSLTRKGIVMSMARQGEKLIIAGDFFRVDGVLSYGVARLNADGKADPTFTHSQNHKLVSFVSTYPDQSILVGSYEYIEKLTPGGSHDESFSRYHIDRFFGLHNTILQPDQKVFIVGVRWGIRLNTDGSLDNSFSYGPICCNSDQFGDLQSDGKLVIVRYTNGTYNDQPVKNIFRVNINGTLDDTFNPGEGFNQDGILLGIDVLDNDDIIASGIFITDYNGVPIANNFAKIKANGALDTDFENNLSNYNIYAAARARQFRDKIIVVNSGNGDLGPLLVLNSNGTASNDITIPSSIISTSGEYVDVWSPDPNTLYVMGNVVTADSRDALPLVRLKYNDDRSRASTTGLNVYPNPADDYIKIDEHKAKLIILSLDGNVKLQTNIEKAGDPVNVSNLPRGRYVLKVVSESKTRTINFIKN